MAKYKILKEFVLNGVTQQEGTVIELDNKMASLKSIQANIEKTDEPQTATKEGSVLSGIVVGQQLTQEQKAKLAKENAIETAEAQRLASERRATDIASGRAEPPVQTVANLIKDKLVNEDFENTPQENIENTPVA